MCVLYVRVSVGLGHEEAEIDREGDREQSPDYLL